MTHLSLAGGRQRSLKTYSVWVKTCDLSKMLWIRSRVYDLFPLNSLCCRVNPLKPIAEEMSATNSSKAGFDVINILNIRHFKRSSCHADKHNHFHKAANTKLQRTVRIFGLYHTFQIKLEVSGWSHWVIFSDFKNRHGGFFYFFFHSLIFMCCKIHAESLFKVHMKLEPVRIWMSPFSITWSHI